MNIRSQLIVAGFGTLVLLSIGAGWHTQSDPNSTRLDASSQAGDSSIQVHYLEIVSSSVDQTCEALEEAHGVEFGEPVPELGNARTADLDQGGRLGVRAPMRDDEKPVVRPYLLVEDIEAAVKAAERAGGIIAMPPTKIPGQGTFSIYLLGGIEHGLWEL